MSLGLLGEGAPDLTLQEMNTKCLGRIKAHSEKALLPVCLTSHVPSGHVGAKPSHRPGKYRRLVVQAAPPAPWEVPPTSPFCHNYLREQ